MGDGSKKAILINLNFCTSHHAGPKDKVKKSGFISKKYSSN